MVWNELRFPWVACQRSPAFLAVDSASSRGLFSGGVCSARITRGRSRSSPEVHRDRSFQADSLWRAARACVQATATVPIASLGPCAAWIRKASFDCIFRNKKIYKNLYIGSHGALG